MAIWSIMSLDEAAEALKDKDCHIVDIERDEKASVVRLVCEGVNYPIPLTRTGIAREAMPAWARKAVRG